MKYFGSKQYEQPNENAVAAERLMAIASRYKAQLPSSSEGFEIAPESEEIPPLDLFDQAPQPEAPDSEQ